MNQMKKDKEQYYEQIELRDIINILNQWKRLIIGFTLVFILLGFIVSTYLISPVYEGKVILAQSHISKLTGNYQYVIKNDEDTINKTSDGIDELVKLAQIDAENYKELITSGIVLQRTIDKIGITINLDEFKEDITVDQDTKQANGVIKISVKAETPEMASNIANTLANQTIIYLGEINNRKMDGLQKTLETQLDRAYKDLDSSVDKLKKHQTQSDLEIGGEIEKRRLENGVKRNEEIIDSLSSKMRELELFRSLNSAENQLIALSPAAVPEKPSSPVKELIVSLAGVFGLMLGLALVFIIEHLKKVKVNELKG